MLACQRPTEILEKHFGPSSVTYPTAESTTTAQTTQLSHNLSPHETFQSKRHLDLPPLHDLSDWNFAKNGSGPVFEDATFDNTTLWSEHRYHCFLDSGRSQYVFTSKVFDGEVACHTSLIKLRREAKTTDVWIQVERYIPGTDSWMVLN